MKNDILVVGSVAFDSVKTIHGESRQALGGSAVYFSLAASFFARVRLVGVVGHDFPEVFTSMLKSREIDIEGLRAVQGQTFCWEGSYDRDFKNATTISTRLNVFENFIPALCETHKKCGVLFLANIDPDLQLGVLRQMNRPRLIACDTMNFWINSKKARLMKVMRETNVLFVNEEEARMITGVYNLIEAGKTLLSKGPSVVVVKKGDNGAMLFAGNDCLPFPAWPVKKVVDPTGAGDTFAGGFMGYLASCSGWRSIKNLKQAMAHGAVLSSFNVENFGVGKVHGLSKADIAGRYRAYVKSLRIE